MKHLRKFNEKLTNEIKAKEEHIKTLFSEIDEEGYYEINIITVEIDSKWQADDVAKICSEITLEPIEGKLWFRPILNPTSGYIETSYERENEILKAKQRTLNKVNVIVEDLKSEGDVIKIMINRIGAIKISVVE